MPAGSNSNLSGFLLFASLLTYPAHLFQSGLPVKLSG